MADTTYIYAGASGSQAGRYAGGLFRRAVGNGGWERIENGLPSEPEIHAIAVDPTNPEVVYAGAQDGPYRCVDRGQRWERVGFPDRDAAVWSIHFQPGNPRTMFIGTSPIGVYRSDDGGDHWRRLDAKGPGRVDMGFACRVTRVAADPSRPDEVYAGLEVDGILRSSDGGRSWTDCSTDLLRLAELPHLRSKIASNTEIEGMMDTHALCLSGARPGTVFLAVRMGLFQSDDRGATWRDMEVGRYSPLTYARDVHVSPHDPKVLYAALSPAARSEDGSIYKSDDLGATWKRVDHGVTARATMMALALHPRDPQQVYGGTRCGQIFGTRDGGKSWDDLSLPPNVADVYTVACG